MGLCQLKSVIRYSHVMEEGNQRKETWTSHNTSSQPIRNYRQLLASVIVNNYNPTLAQGPWPCPSLVTKLHVLLCLTMIRDHYNVHNKGAGAMQNDSL